MKVYEFNEGTAKKNKPWSLLMRQDRERVNIEAVCDRTGKRIAYIAVLGSDGLFVRWSAKDLLKIGGYDTSLTQWEENGAIKVLS